MNATNNVIQQPNLFARQVIVTFRYHNAEDDLDSRLTGAILEMNNPYRDGEVSLEAGRGQLHFEGVTYKSGCYWILVGVHNTNIIRLGDLATPADFLFTQSGRDRICAFLVGILAGVEEGPLHLIW